MTTPFNNRDRAIILRAISVAIEHENRAIEVCCRDFRGGFFGVNDAIVERKRALREFERLRARLIGRGSGIAAD